MNIVITGSTKGIGCGMGQRFLESGHKLLINGRDETRTANALEKMRADFPGRTVISYTCNVSDYNSVVKMYDYAVEALGSVDIWINNAGMSQNFESFHEHDTDIMNQIVDVNIKGVLNGAKIAWLTTSKIMFRFFTQPFVKREIVTPEDFSHTSPT